MEYNVYYDGVIVYRNLFTSIIRPKNQQNVRKDYVKYIVLNDNNIIMSFACKEELDPYEEYLKRKNL
jgi:hypothetical protein